MDGGVTLINVNKFDDGWWNIDPSNGQKTTPITWNSAKYGDPVSTDSSNIYFLPYSTQAPPVAPNIASSPWSKAYKRNR